MALTIASPRDLGARALADAGDLKAAGLCTATAAGALKTTADGAGAFNSLLAMLDTGLNLSANPIWVAVPLIRVVAWLLASQLVRARVEAHRTGQNLIV